MIFPPLDKGGLDKDKYKNKTGDNKEKGTATRNEEVRIGQTNCRSSQKLPK